MKDEFCGNLGHYKLIPTADGSNTLWSEFFNENCHSVEGASQETLYNYISPCLIVSRICQSPVTILEVGLGTGLGVIETYQALSSIKDGYPLTFISLEIDEALIKWAIKNQTESSSQFPKLSTLKKISRPGYEFYFATKNGHTLYVLCGNATTSLPLFLKDNPFTFTAIYQDAFSPAKNPDLWSHEWFTLLYKHSHQDVILSTYSCASAVKKHLKQANWFIKKRQGFGKKRESLTAQKSDYVV